MDRVTCRTAGSETAYKDLGQGQVGAGTGNPSTSEAEEEKSFQSKQVVMQKGERNGYSLSSVGRKP
jgi:hypothetical protein